MSNVRRLNMLFAMVEDGTVRVLPDHASAKRAFEGIDVENRVVVFYSEDGTLLVPQFLRANKRKWFGLVAENGEYELVAAPDGAPEYDTFEVAINEAEGVEPNPHFKSASEIRAYVEGQKNAR
jgi:hypothetical protein